MAPVSMNLASKLLIKLVSRFWVSQSIKFSSALQQMKSVSPWQLLANHDPNWVELIWSLLFFCVRWRMCANVWLFEHFRVIVLISGRNSQAWRKVSILKIKIKRIKQAKSSDKHKLVWPECVGADCVHGWTKKALLYFKLVQYVLCNLIINGGYVTLACLLFHHFCPSPQVLKLNTERLLWVTLCAGVRVAWTTLSFFALNLWFVLQLII